MSRDSLHRWLLEPSGQILLAAETNIVGRALTNLFGYHIVQVGEFGRTDLMAQSRILNRLVIAVAGDGAVPTTGTVRGGNFDSGVCARRDPRVRAQATQLPINSDSVDVVVLPHVLEFESNPHEALREAMRVLMPEGHVIICGFNPFSFFGLWRLAARRLDPGPWAGQFLRPDRIKDWLALLGFDLIDVQGCFYRPPLRHEALLRRLAVLERIPLRPRPLLCGAYTLVGRKRVTTVTPIRTRWRPQPRFAGAGLAGRTRRDGVASDR